MSSTRYIKTPTGSENALLPARDHAKHATPAIPISGRNQDFQRSRNIKTLPTPNWKQRMKVVPDLNVPPTVTFKASILLSRTLPDHHRSLRRPTSSICLKRCRVPKEKALTRNCFQSPLQRLNQRHRLRPIVWRPPTGIITNPSNIAVQPAKTPTLGLLGQVDRVSTNGQTTSRIDLGDEDHRRSTTPDTAYLMAAPMLFSRATARVVQGWESAETGDWCTSGEFVRTVHSRTFSNNPRPSALSLELPRGVDSARAEVRGGSASGSLSSILTNWERHAERHAAPPGSKAGSEYLAPKRSPKPEEPPREARLLGQENDPSLHTHYSHKGELAWDKKVKNEGEFAWDKKVKNETQEKKKAQETKEAEREAEAKSEKKVVARKPLSPAHMRKPTIQESRSAFVSSCTDALRKKSHSQRTTKRCSSPPEKDDLPLHTHYSYEHDLAWDKKVKNEAQEKKKAGEAKEAEREAGAKSKKVCTEAFEPGTYEDTNNSRITQRVRQQLHGRAAQEVALTKDYYEERIFKHAARSTTMKRESSDAQRQAQQGSGKEYVAVVQFHASLALGKAEFRAALEKLEGAVFQTPPEISAVKKELRVRTAYEITAIELVGQLFLPLVVDSHQTPQLYIVHLHPGVIPLGHTAVFSQGKTFNDDRYIRSVTKPIEYLLADYKRIVRKVTAVTAICHEGFITLTESRNSRGEIPLLTMHNAPTLSSKNARSRRESRDGGGKRRVSLPRMGEPGARCQEHAPGPIDRTTFTRVSEHGKLIITSSVSRLGRGHPRPIPQDESGARTNRLEAILMFLLPFNSLQGSLQQGNDDGANEPTLQQNHSGPGNDPAQYLNGQR
ncbi:MAG: H/ACA ribonucleoprotein complex subunit dkc1 [Alyxoria varia]|nr:MAG: H/ACA ribonucleoprotein complex subunit dkc1 [Alyxoria varia]